MSIADVSGLALLQCYVFEWDSCTCDSNGRKKVRARQAVSKIKSMFSPCGRRVPRWKIRRILSRRLASLVPLHCFTQRTSMSSSPCPGLLKCSATYFISVILQAPRFKSTYFIMQVLSCRRRHWFGIVMIWFSIVLILRTCCSISVVTIFIWYLK